MAHRGARDDLLFALGEPLLWRPRDAIVLREEESFAVVIEPIDERPLCTDHRPPECARSVGIDATQLPPRAIDRLRGSGQVPARRDRVGRSLLELAPRRQYSERGVGRDGLWVSPQSE